MISGISNSGLSGSRDGILIRRLLYENSDKRIPGENCEGR